MLSASGPELTEYHLEAAIAWVHATAPRAEDTDWETIVSLYDQLMAIRPSPVVALNRAIAIAQREGPAARARGDPRHRRLAIASPAIPSTPPRSASLSFAAAGPRSRASTSRAALALRAQSHGAAIPRAARYGVLPRHSPSHRKYAGDPSTIGSAMNSGTS